MDIENENTDFKRIMDKLPLAAVLGKIVFFALFFFIYVHIDHFNKKYLQVSPFSEKQDIFSINNLASHALPEFFKNNPDWLDIINNVASNGTENSFIRYFPEYKLWMQFRFFSPKRGYFAWIGNDITDKMTCQQQMKRIEGILPICSHCKKIRDPSGKFLPIEEYFHEYAKIKLSHGICEECIEQFYPEFK